MEISPSVPKPFTPDEEEHMRHDTTNAALNEARRAAKYTSGEIAIRGDDLSYRGQKKEFESHGTHEKADIAVHAVSTAIELGEIGGAAGMLAPAGVLVGGAIAFHHLMEANEHGEQLSKTLGKDEMHLALLHVVDVPKGYRDTRVLDRKDSGQSFASGAQTMAREIIFRQPGVRAALQLHCDQGMAAARRMLENGQSKDAFLAANPEVSKRYAEDAAFQEGFEALQWAREQKTGDAYKETIKALESRDARYDAVHIPCRA